MFGTDACVHIIMYVMLIGIQWNSTGDTVHHGWAKFSTKWPCIRVMYRIRPQSDVGLHIRAMRVLYALQSGCGPL